MSDCDCDDCRHARSLGHPHGYHGPIPPMGVEELLFIKEDNEKWLDASRHLLQVVSNYLSIGSHGQLALHLSIKPMIDRYLGDPPRVHGDRTQEFHDEIMKLE